MTTGAHSEDARDDDHVSRREQQAPQPDAPQSPTAWLTEILVSEAGRHEPDDGHLRALMRERVNRSRHGRTRLSVLGIRLAGVPAGIAAAALCATVAVAVTATVATRQPSQPTNSARQHAGPQPAGTGASRPAASSAASPGTKSPVTGDGADSTTAPAGPLTSGSAPASPSTSAGSAQASTSSSATNQGTYLATAQGSVSPASNPSWTEEDVTVTLDKPVDGLQLIVRVAPSVGLTNTSYWANHDISVFDVTVAPQSGGLTFTFRLKPGQSLAAGQIEFGAQFGHTSPHDPTGDTYALSVASDGAGGSSAAVSQGSF
ncbi:MAG: hypothetical protein ACRDVE_03865 [Actinocrinis sp.]